MAAVAGLVAHGGLGGAIVEPLVFLAVAAVLIAVWLRERRSRRDHVRDGPVQLRDDE